MENSGVVHMLMHTRTVELACMYKLLSRVDEGLRTVADAVSAHLREQGRALVTDTHSNTNAIAYVQVIRTPLKLKPLKSVSYEIIYIIRITNALY